MYPAGGDGAHRENGINTLSHAPRKVRGYSFLDTLGWLTGIEFYPSVLREWLQLDLARTFEAAGCATDSATTIEALRNTFVPARSDKLRWCCQGDTWDSALRR